MPAAEQEYAIHCAPRHSKSKTTENKRNERKRRKRKKKHQSGPSHCSSESHGPVLGTGDKILVIGGIRSSFVERNDGVLSQLREIALEPEKAKARHILLAIRLVILDEKRERVRIIEQRPLYRQFEHVLSGEWKRYLQRLHRAQVCGGGEVDVVAVDEEFECARSAGGGVGANQDGV